MVLIALQNDEQGTRIGVTAGRSVGKAVQRNRAKRLLRSAVQPILDDLRTGWDLVLIARNPLMQAPFWQIQMTLKSLLDRARLIKNHE